MPGAVAPLRRGVLRLAGWAEGLAFAGAAGLGLACAFGLGGASAWGDYWAARPGSRAEDEAWSTYERWNAASSFGALVGFGCGLAMAILLMILGFRVLKVARGLGARMGLGPGWAIGAWFIPCASFVLAPLVSANVRRVAAWRGAAPISDQWRTSYPASAVIISVATVVAAVMSGVGGVSADTRSGAVGLEAVSALSFAANAVALLAGALLIRGTRRSLADSPLVSPW